MVSAPSPVVTVLPRSSTARIVPSPPSIRCPPMSRLLLIVILSLSAPAAFAKTILVLGDSISAAYGMAMEDGWVNLLRQRLDAERPGHYTVINASVSGDRKSTRLNSSHVKISYAVF